MMRRIAFASLAFVTLLWGAPPSAQADECMCVAADVRGSEAPEPHSGHTRTASGHIADATDMPGSNGPILWCRGNDDPRCMPVGGRGNGSDTLQLPSKSPRAAASGAPHIRDPAAHAARLPSDPSRPRPGVRRRIERPPKH